MGGDPWARAAFPLSLAKVPSFPNQSDPPPAAVGSGVAPAPPGRLPAAIPCVALLGGGTRSLCRRSPQSCPALHACSPAGTKPLQAPPTLTWEQSSERPPRGPGARRERRNGARRRIKGNMEGRKGRGGAQGHPLFFNAFQMSVEQGSRIGAFASRGLPS